MRLAALASAPLRRWRERRAQDSFERQLPSIVCELAAHVRAGRSLAQAIEGIPGDIAEPGASTMRKCAASVSLGQPPFQALRALGEGEQVELLAAALALQARTGGDLAALLDRLSEALAERRAHLRASEVATAQARATARMVSWMPAAGMAGLLVVDGQAAIGLLRSPAGWAALVLAGALTVVGRVLIARIARVTP